MLVSSLALVLALGAPNTAPQAPRSSYPLDSCGSPIQVEEGGEPGTRPSERSAAGLAAVRTEATPANHAPATAPARPEHPWPPIGPAWITSPSEAFARAREERKVVLVYAGTGGCPHCVVMARDTWPHRELVETMERVVPLAIHVSDDEPWAVRTGVIGYPQLRFYDGWGRRFRGHERARTPEEVQAAVIAQSGRTIKPAPRRRLPGVLSRMLSTSERRLAVDDDCEVRAAVWLDLLERTELEPRLLLALYEAETDAVVRIEVLDRLVVDGRLDRSTRELLLLALETENDWVRGKGIPLIARTRDPRLIEEVIAVVGKVLTRQGGYENPNNVLIMAAEALGTARARAGVDCLERILKQEKANNGATTVAVRSLWAIGEEHGLAAVEDALRQALLVQASARWDLELQRRLEESLHDLAREALQALGA